MNSVRNRRLAHWIFFALLRYPKIARAPSKACKTGYGPTLTVIRRRQHASKLFIAFANCLDKEILVVQREGKLRLASERIWVDLAEWESWLRQALNRSAAERVGASDLEHLFLNFSGPVLLNERLAAWLAPVVERVRNQFVDLARRIGQKREAEGKFEGARAVYLRALDFYPHSTRLYKALIQGRLAEGDAAGAVADYARYERTLRATGQGAPSFPIRALIQPFLEPAAANSRRISDP